MPVKHLFVLLITVMVFSYCSKKNNNPPVNTVTNFTIAMSGANESSPNASAATGTGTATFDNATKAFSMTVNFSGITATLAHIHKALPGVSGPVEFPLGITSPITFSATLTASQENDLLEGKYYVNIHSAAYPAGEIRGQINKQ